MSGYNEILHPVRMCGDDIASKTGAARYRSLKVKGKVGETCLAGW